MTVICQLYTEVIVKCDEFSFQRFMCSYVAECKECGFFLYCSHRKGKWKIYFNVFSVKYIVIEYAIFQM